MRWRSWTVVIVEVRIRYSNHLHTQTASDCPWPDFVCIYEWIPLSVPTQHYISKSDCSLFCLQRQCFLCPFCCEQNFCTRLCPNQLVKEDNEMAQEYYDPWSNTRTKNGLEADWSSRQCRSASEGRRRTRPCAWHMSSISHPHSMRRRCGTACWWFPWRMWALATPRRRYL